MISKKYEQLVFAFFMALLMTCVMSLAISIFNIGLVDGILSIWLKAWGFAFCAAFPTMVIVSPMVKRLVKLVINDNG